MEMIVEHRREVLGNARHASCADRLDPRLLDRLEHAACLRIAGHQLAMHLGIVTGELQRNRIRMATDHGGIALGHFSRRLRQPRLAGRKPGPLCGEGHVQFGRLRDRLEAGSDRALERLGRRFPGAAEF